MGSINYLDKAGATWLVSKIKTALGLKADKTELPTKLSELESDTTHRVVTDSEKITWNGKQDTVIWNSAYNKTSNKGATMKDVNDAVASVTGIEFKVVETLPATGKTGVIYLIASSTTATQNIYDEYIWLSGSSSYEKIGSTSVDLSNCVKYDDMIAITNEEITAMFE